MEFVAKQTGMLAYASMPVCFAYVMEQYAQRTSHRSWALLRFSPV
jgi:hypothetical protein